MGLFAQQLSRSLVWAQDRGPGFLWPRGSGLLSARWPSLPSRHWALGIPSAWPAFVRFLQISSPLSGEDAQASRPQNSAHFLGRTHGCVKRGGKTPFAILILSCAAAPQGRRDTSAVPASLSCGQRARCVPRGTPRLVHFLQPPAWHGAGRNKCSSSSRMLFVSLNGDRRWRLNLSLMTYLSP